ncbi:MAG TPA: aminopeptidase [Candidatus Faecalibacterium gallistercoris]|uniref:M18 family aminopeptidase n=1 Tax=Candidatus Faecalibacterium gallistercoris TaxID=2838579 RepID=A0A9D2FG30_9FIRM|nr:aminopeptidase [Candidatus Faecalibacterium gallistercoris]
MKEMTEAQQKAKALLYEPAYASDKDAATRQAAAAFGEGYKDFLTRCKTEREVAAYAEEALKAAGYQLYDDRKQYAAGDKIYWIHQGKVVLCGTIGTRSMEDGFHLVIAHIDAPRLDIRPNPLYEAAHFSLLKTHYYGGIRKYQWATMPLAIHGVFTRADGTTVTVQVGEDVGDPAFCITDLLPHLSAEQNKRELSDGIRGEELNILIGSDAVEDEEIKEKVKLQTMILLHEKYGITEKDFTRAELEIVPATPARDIGFDRSMVGGYGQDDRVDAYAALMAEIEVKDPAFTTICVLADKEEIGSYGITGMGSTYTFDWLRQLCRMQGADDIRAFRASLCLSADVTAAYDPTWSSAFEPQNGTYAGRGVAFFKYTGSRGKSGANDASAEQMGYLTRMMDAAGVAWQIGELGRIDLGGGGTVATEVAHSGIAVVDIGVPVLSMHSPFEVVSKNDLYMAYRAFSTFIAAKQ